MKKLLALLKSKFFWINIGAFIGLGLLLLFIFDFALGVYTHHGESLTVPDFRGMKMDEAAKLCEDKELRYLIKDTVFDPSKPLLSVVDQNPKANAKVKSNRRIYFSLNGDKPPMVSLPNIVGGSELSSLRHAQNLLESLGFKLGNTDFEPHPYLNVVLKAKYKGRIVMPGAQLPKGATIDLVLGDGGKNVKVEIPDLIGKNLNEAEVILKAYHLNLGSVHGDSSEVDNQHASVYKQRPTPGEGKKISQGEPVDIWIRKD